MSHQPSLSFSWICHLNPELSVLSKEWIRVKLDTSLQTDHMLAERRIALADIGGFPLLSPTHAFCSITHRDLRHSPFHMFIFEESLWRILMSNHLLNHQWCFLKSLENKESISSTPPWGVAQDGLLLCTCRTNDESAGLCELERVLYLQLDFSKNFALVLRGVFKE